MPDVVAGAAPAVAIAVGPALSASIAAAVGVLHRLPCSASNQFASHLLLTPDFVQGLCGPRCTYFSRQRPSNFAVWAQRGASLVPETGCATCLPLSCRGCAGDARLLCAAVLKYADNILRCFSTAPPRSGGYRRAVTRMLHPLVVKTSTFEALKTVNPKPQNLKPSTPKAHRVKP